MLLYFVKYAERAYHRAVVEMYLTNSVKGRGSEDAPQLRHTHYRQKHRLTLSIPRQKSSI